MIRIALLALTVGVALPLLGCQSGGASSSAGGSEAIYSQEPVSQIDAAVQQQNRIGEVTRSGIR